MIELENNYNDDHNGNDDGEDDDDNDKDNNNYVKDFDNGVAVSWRLDSVGHSGAPLAAILDLAGSCSQWASASFAAKLVFLMKISTYLG